MHQILRNNALDISLYNSLYGSDIILTVSTIVSCSNNFSTKLGNGCWATAAPKNDANHVHRITYYVP